MIQNKKGKTLIIVLLIIVALVSALVFWQWNNINALMEYKKYSSSELEKQISSKEEAIAGALDKLPGTVNDLSDADKERLSNGEITLQQAIDIMTGQNNNKSGLNGEGDSEATTDKSAKEKQINELIAQIYALRSTYLSKIDFLVQSAISEYKALPEEQRSSSKASIFIKFAGNASGLEGECDAAINSIVAELEPLIRETNGDLSLIDDIKNAYASEKSLKKAYYISLFRNN